MSDSIEQIVLSHEDAGRTLWADGHYWRVHEIPAPVFDRRGGSHLIFECLEIVRRVRDYPENWMELGDADLYALCDRRQSARD
ncbi:MAG TPA: hypothetical protein VKH19_00475 [Gemmatimonadaceae bacterium]|nr:hypothetical protein [Gemmatimonadaceae bacterium]